MAKKLIYLFLALLMPIGVFVFLRLFGKNEFTIPTYYETGVTESPASCGYQYTVPYTVPDSVLKKMGKHETETITLLIADTSATIQSSLTRFSEEFESTSYQILMPGSDASWDHAYACFFFLKKPWSAVLIDSERKIRGYYTPDSREEMDRLIVEMKILLKQY